MASNYKEGNLQSSTDVEKGGGCKNLYEVFLGHLIKYYEKITDTYEFYSIASITFLLSFLFGIPFFFAIFSGVSLTGVLIASIYPLVVIIIGVGFLRAKSIKKKFLNVLKTNGLESAKSFAEKHQEIRELKLAVAILELLKNGDYSSAFDLYRNPEFVEYYKRIGTALDKEMQVGEFFDILKTCLCKSKR